MCAPLPGAQRRGRGVARPINPALQPQIHSPRPTFAPQAPTRVAFMVSSNLRTTGLAAALLGALAAAISAYDLWLAFEADARLTVIGIALNLAPGAILLILGASLIARPRRTTVAFWAAPLWAPFAIYVAGAAAARPNPIFAAV